MLYIYPMTNGVTQIIKLIRFYTITSTRLSAMVKKLSTLAKRGEIFFLFLWISDLGLLPRG